jgi:cytidylate kinase
MLVITISRQYGSGGSLFARNLAEHLGYSYLDEAFIKKLNNDDEVTAALFASIEDEPEPSLSMRLKDLFSKRSFFKLALEASIYEMALNNHVVIVGGGAHIILQGYPGMIAIQVVRNLSDRVKDIATEKGIAYEEALKLIEQRDKAKRKFITYYFDRELFNPLDFNLTFNASMVTLEDGIHILDSYAKRHFSRVNMEEARSFLTRRLLEKKAEILLLKKGLDSHYGKITFEAIDDDTLVVKGIIDGEEKKKRLMKALMGLKGLKNVEERLKVEVLSGLLY